MNFYNDYYVHISPLSFFNLPLFLSEMRRCIKSLKGKIVLIEFGVLFYRGIKIWKKMIRYVVQNNRKCLQNSQAFIDAKRDSFYCIEKIDSEFVQRCCFDLCIE